MSLVKKIKDILFEEEEYTEPIKIQEEKKEEEPKIIKIESPKEEVDTPSRVTANKEVTSERELFKNDNNFKFPDFDEEEFASSMSRPKQNANVLDYERKKNVEKRDYRTFERQESREPRENVEKRKFKPSPIISPVYGILNQDYKAEDIVKKSDDASNIDIDTVRKKAFEFHKEETIETISEPVVTFFEDKKEDVKEEKDEYKTIDDLLEEASTEIPLEDTLELPKTNNLDAIEEELEKIEEETKEKKKEADDNLDDTLDNDLFELIDSMYDEREEG